MLGYLLVKFGLPLAPLILGVILGDQIEVNLVRALMTDGDPLALPHPPDLGRHARALGGLGRVRAVAAPPPVRAPGDPAGRRHRFLNSSLRFPLPNGRGQGEGCAR